VWRWLIYIHKCCERQFVFVSFVSFSNASYGRCTLNNQAYFLPEHDYVTFESSLSQIRLSSVTFVRPTHGVETFNNSSSLFCTLAILWPPCKILQRSSQGNPSVGCVKHRRGSKLERCHVRVSHLLMSFLFISCSSTFFNLQSPVLNIEVYTYILCFVGYHWYWITVKQSYYMQRSRLYAPEDFGVFGGSLRLIYSVMVACE